MIDEEAAMEIEFECANCGAKLKVKAAAAGRKLRCPRCGKLTDVPKVEASDSAARAVPVSPSRRGKIVRKAESPPASDLSSQIVEEADAAVPSVSEPKPDIADPRLGMLEQQISELTEKLRQTEAKLEIAQLRAAQAEEGKQGAIEKMQSQEKEIEAKIAEHYQSEILAAKKTIGDLEGKLTAEVKKRVEERSRQTGRSAAEIERDLLRAGTAQSKDENVIDPDALVSEIQVLPFGKVLRASVLIHICVIAVTSIGYLVWLAQGKPEKEKPPAPASAEVAPAPSADKAGTSGTPDEPVRAVAEGATNEETEIRGGTKRSAGKSAIEKSIESLPEKGEVPTDTSVSLDL